MTPSRRAVLAAVPALTAWPALAQKAPAALETYERDTGGRVGLYAQNLATGARIAWRADERFVMCSTFKASLAACVLSRADDGKEFLERRIPYGPADLMDYAPTARQNLAAGAMTVEDMCKAAVELSDNTCANLLLAAVGGPPALTAFWRAIGDQTSRLDHNEPVLNRSPPGDPHDTTTPAAMAANLRRLLLTDVLPRESKAKLTGWMVDCQTGAKRLRAGLPKTWKVADKTGANGKDAAGDIAVVWPGAGAPVLIACYVQGGTPKPDQIDAVFAEAGKLAGARLGG